MEWCRYRLSRAGRRLTISAATEVIEFCKGEAQDAEAGLNWLVQQPRFDPARIAVKGLSHGGCIGLHTWPDAPRGWCALVTMPAPVAIG